MYSIKHDKDKSYKGIHKKHTLLNDLSEIGFAISRPTQGEDTIGLSELFISPEYQGQGLSKLLIDDVKKTYNKDIMLRANPYKNKALNKKSLTNLYESQGFKLEDDGRMRYKNSSDCYSEAIEKVALNAQKARAMAKKVGLIPEANWKYGLRNLRNMKTGELLNGKELREAKGKLGSLNNNAYQKLKSMQRKQLPGTEMAGEITSDGSLINKTIGDAREFKVKFKNNKTNMHTHPIDLGETRFETLMSAKNLFKNQETINYWDRRDADHMVGKVFGKQRRGPDLPNLKGNRTVMSVEPSGLDLRYNLLGGDRNNLNSRIKNLKKNSNNDLSYSMRTRDGYEVKGGNTVANYLHSKHTGPIAQDMKNIDGYGKHTIVNTKQDLEGIHRLRGDKMSSVYFDRGSRNN